MDPSGQPNDRPDEELDTADEEQPGPECRGGRAEEQDAADDEPDCDKDVIDDAGDFIAFSDDEFFVANTDSNVAIAHRITVVSAGCARLSRDGLSGHEVMANWLEQIPHEAAT